MSKREAVPKHSLPPQKQILSYMGRFINCPYAPDTEAPEFFCGQIYRVRKNIRANRMLMIQVPTLISLILPVKIFTKT